MFHHSDSIAKLAEALVKAQAQMKPAIKDSDNPYFKSKYADLASVWDALREPLTSNGLCVTQTTDKGEGSPAVTIITTLIHVSGEWVSGELTLTPAKNDPQGFGAAITYGRRFGLSAITGMCTEDEDDDGNAAAGHACSKSGAVRTTPATANRVSEAVAGLVTKAVTVDHARQETEGEVKCAICGKPIGGGLDASGKPFNAGKMAKVSGCLPEADVLLLFRRRPR